MVSGFERAKAEALAYLEARTAKARERRDRSNCNNESKGKSKGNSNDEIRGSFASLEDDDVKQATTTAKATTTAMTKYRGPPLRSRMTT